jgi:hypothetical protein
MTLQKLRQIIDEVQAPDEVSALEKATMLNALDREIIASGPGQGIDERKFVAMGTALFPNASGLIEQIGARVGLTAKVVTVAYDFYRGGQIVFCARCCPQCLTNGDDVPEGDYEIRIHPRGKESPSRVWGRLSSLGDGVSVLRSVSGEVRTKYPNE